MSLPSEVKVKTWKLPPSLTSAPYSPSFVPAGVVRGRPLHANVP
jgi:hypothetical protein